MNNFRGLHHVSAQAMVPEQLLHYVAAVSASRPRLFGDCVGHVYDNSVVLAGYPLHGDVRDSAHVHATLDAALTLVQQDQNLERITVLAPLRPHAAPAGSRISHDNFWALPLPPAPPRQKLRNILHRARRDVRLEQNCCWSQPHETLVAHYLHTRPLEAGMRHIFQHLGNYVHKAAESAKKGTAKPDVLVFSAYSPENTLLACAIGDYSSLHTAFYLFAFRRPDAPPGTSDLLLEALCAEGTARGHSRVNLGLGINAGISFFKQKWQAEIFLPCVESAWKKQKPQKSWLSRLFSSPDTAPPPNSPAHNLPADTDPLSNPAFKNASGLECLLEIVGKAPQKKLDCLQVEVTSQCAGRCTYCPHTTQAGEWRSRSMQAATFAALWPLLRTTGRVHLQGWGEPLLHPRFFDFAALGLKAGCQVSTTSCGLHMNEEIAEKIVQSGMDIVAFSLVGTDAVSNAPRVGVPFDKVCEAVHCLQNIRKKRLGAHLELHLAYLMLADSMDAVKNLPELMRDLGIPVAVVSTLDYLAVPEHKAWAFDPHEEEKIAQARHLLQQASAKAKTWGQSLHYSLPNPLPSIQCRENIQRNMYVDAEGQCAPCIYLNVPTNDLKPQSRVFGSVANEAALDIWHKPEFTRFRNSLADQRPEGACVCCPKRYDSPAVLNDQY